MAFDACTMRAVLSELSREYPDAKIEKINQPLPDEIVFLIHSGKRSTRLLFNLGPNAPRMQLSEVQKENPLKAPMFCMFLRKRLSGARIVEVEQPGFDRIAKLHVMGYDEMGFSCKMFVVCEIMGKYANFLLLDENEKIISALKLIDFAASTVRQVLPGLKYQTPRLAAKIPPVEMTEEKLRELMEVAGEGQSVEKFIISTYSGVATQIARELAYRAVGFTDALMGATDKRRLLDVLLSWQSLLVNESYTPTAITDTEGKPLDYSYMDISYYQDKGLRRVFSSFGELFDFYFAEKDRIERIHRRAHDIRTLISSAVSRTEKKLAIQREALIESEKGEDYRRFGDLITANIYKMKKGDKELVCQDYYSEDCHEVRVPLDEKLSPSANAQRMYKLYNKCKTAKAVLTEQIARWEEELRYLESVSAFLERAECEQDITDIREELYRSGYSSRLKGYKPQKSQQRGPMTFETSGGYKLLVGRNNIQNDQLSTKTASKEDIWFHTKDIPGSHVIMITEGEEPSAQDYTEAAEIAAGYSSAKGDLVAVDYTKVRNVKKPSGAKPGYVIYKTNYTAFVKPKKRIGD